MQTTRFELEAFRNPGKRENFYKLRSRLRSDPLWFVTQDMEAAGLKRDLVLFDDKLALTYAMIAQSVFQRDKTALTAPERLSLERRYRAGHIDRHNETMMEHCDALMWDMVGDVPAGESFVEWAERVEGR